MTMLRRLFQLALILLPLGLFVAVLFVVQEQLDHDQVLLGLALLLAALALLALLEGLLFRYWILPDWGRALSERLYAGSYTPDQDPLASLVAQLAEEHDAQLLAKLEQLVRRDPRRVRGWLEWARLLAEEYGNPAGAVDVLLEGERRVRAKEDRAMLLCRAAHLCETRLKDTKKAEELHTAAARRYPRTTYGKLAQSRLQP